MPQSALSNNETIRILSDAEKGGYGVPAPIVYNIEHIIAFIRAAEAKRSPLIIQLFPWAVTFSAGLLVRAAADAASRAAVPVAVHLDHATSEPLIRAAADDLPFDSIMVDMSHYEMDENLAKTAALVGYCHERGVAVEAEPGRIEGGEDGVAEMGVGEGRMTTEEEVESFVETGVDFLAPSFGNVHGEYGVRGPRLDFERLELVRKAVGGRVKIVLHGTNDFDEEIMRRCIRGGVSKVNVNKLVLDDYLEHLKREASNLPLTQLMEQGVEKVVKRMEWLVDVCGSERKA